MGLMIYNSLTNKIEEFKTVKPNTVNMYVCGPTVYNYIHIGNARPVIFYDMLKRYLTYIGYEVNYVSNITDIDDKIINKALSENVSEKDIASLYEMAYFKNCRELNSNRPDQVPHATEYITDMITFIDDLVKKDYAYNVDGDVYFRVNKLKNYGILSNQVTEDLEAGSRVDISNKKENSLDFSLWKKTDKGIKWSSPFGEGRPGWHTECVCMVDKLFNHNIIDIHGGGMDLKFPHHENEIAQSEALRGNKIANFWMHVGRIVIKKGETVEKMSKSLGNTVLVNDFKTHRELMALRLLIVSQPYRNTVTYSDDLFKQYLSEYDKFDRAIKQASLQLDYNEIEVIGVNEEDKNQFINYMNQDLNCQNVMTLLNDLLKQMNQALRVKDYHNVGLKLNMINEIMNVFGVEFEYIPLTEENRSLYNEWNLAKSNKDFEKADSLRTILSEKGIL